MKKKRNPIAVSLQSNKYHQKVIPNKKKALKNNPPLDET